MHAEIVKRLEEAGGPSRDLDEAIAFALRLRPDPERNWQSYASFMAHERKHDYETAWTAHHPWRRGWFPAFTAAIAEAMALVDRILPGWAKGFDSGPKTTIAFVDPHDHADRMFGARYTAEAATPALAMLLALFRSLQEKDR